MNKKINDLISRYFSDISTSKELNLLNEWLKEDEEHIRYFFRQQNLQDNLHPPFSLSDIDSKSALKNIICQAGIRKRSFPLWQKLTAAAIILIGMTVIFHLIYTPSSKSSYTTAISVTPSAILTLPSGEEITFDKWSSQKITGNNKKIAYVENSCIHYTQGDSISTSPIYHHLEIPRGSEFFLILSDNTKIWLNAETKVKFPEQFSIDERKIFIEGEAYMEVSHQPERPFKVIISNYEITVLGTSFNVNTYPEESVTRITLVDGKVEVCSEITHQKVSLLPGEQALIHKGSNVISKKNVDPDIDCSWHYGRIIFKNTSLKEILHKFARWYDVRIIWEDESLKNITFSGEMKKYDSIEQSLHVIGQTNEVNFKIQNRTIIVKRHKNKIGVTPVLQSI